MTDTDFEAMVAHLLDNVTVMSEAESLAAMGAPVQRQEQGISPQAEARFQALEAAIHRLGNEVQFLSLLREVEGRGA